MVWEHAGGDLKCNRKAFKIVKLQEKALTVLTTSSRLSKMLLYSRAFAIRVCCFETEADSTGCYQVNNKFGRLLTVANNDEIFLAVAIFARDYTSAAAETNIVVNIRNLNGFVFTWF